MNLSSEINGAFIVGGDETTWVELSYRFMDPQLGVDAAFWVDKNHIWKHIFLSIMGLDKQKSFICANYSQLRQTQGVTTYFFWFLRIINSDTPHFWWGKAVWMLPIEGSSPSPRLVPRSVPDIGPPLVLDRGSWLCSIQVINALDLKEHNRKQGEVFRRWDGPERS